MNLKAIIQPKDSKYGYLTAVFDLTDPSSKQSIGHLELPAAQVAKFDITKPITVTLTQEN